tara:strand:- start:24179 stop:24469 length:291 start_codon:yes stop_codon:yes gene_type:complete
LFDIGFDDIDRAPIQAKLLPASTRDASSVETGIEGENITATAIAAGDGQSTGNALSARRPKTCPLSLQEHEPCVRPKLMQYLGGRREVSHMRYPPV